MPKLRVSIQYNTPVRGLLKFLLTLNSRPCFYKSAENLFSTLRRAFFAEGGYSQDEDNGCTETW